MKLSKQLFQQKMKKPLNFDLIETKDAIEKAGFIEFLDAGFPYFSPIGQRIKTNLEKLLIDACQNEEFERVQLPLLQRKEIVERSGKYSQFKSEFIDVLNNYVLSSTSEEYFLELAKKGLESYSQLPIRLFEIGEAVRFIKRPQGILKLREFSGAVLISFEENQEGYENSLTSFRRIVEFTLEKLKVPFRIEKKNDGVEYFYTSPRQNSNDSLSLAMGYKFDSLIQNSTVNFRARNNSLKPIVVGTFGIGLERLFYAVCDSCRDYKGFNFPEIVRPYESAIIIIDPKNDSQLKMGEDLYSKMKEIGRAVYLDDRVILTLKKKLDYADFLGVKEKIIIGTKEVKERKFTIKVRTVENEKDINSIF